MATTTEPAGLVHAAFFYRDRHEYLDTVGAFIRDGLDAGEPVAVAVPAANIALLREALGAIAEEVAISDMADVGGNPARTFGMFAQLCLQHPGRRIRIIAEPVWPGGRSVEEYPACVQNEALWNTAFAECDVLTLCPYDAAGLPETVLADARTTHPSIWQDGGTSPSTEYMAIEAFVRYNEPLPTDPRAVTSTLYALEDLSPARALAAQYAQSRGLSPERIGDLQLILSELATNSLSYTAHGCRLALWQQDANLICQISDRGRLDDPMAGRRLPDLQAIGGRGLFLVNALADLVRTHTGDFGTTIQVYLRLAT